MKVVKTSILLKDLQFYAYHGVLPQEKTVGGEYKVDLTLDISVPLKALQEDDLNGTINYAEVYHLIKLEMQQPVDLLERLSYKIADRLLLHFQEILKVKIEVCKVNPPIGAACSGASVVLEVER